VDFGDRNHGYRMRTGIEAELRMSADHMALVSAGL
jgi:hypothetical protein